MDEASLGCFEVESGYFVVDASELQRGVVVVEGLGVEGDDAAPARADWDGRPGPRGGAGRRGREPGPVGADGQMAVVVSQGEGVETVGGGPGLGNTADGRVITVTGLEERYGILGTEDDVVVEPEHPIKGASLFEKELTEGEEGLVPRLGVDGDPA